MNRAAAWALLALLAAPPGALAQASPAAASGTQWWGSTDLDEGYHLRVPVTVTNTANAILRDPVAMAELDIARLLKEAGWPSKGTDAQPEPESFNLDLDSVRVVHMWNLAPQGSGVNGKLRPYDTTQADDNKPVAPSLAIPGLIDQEGSRPYNPRTNPSITVFWRLEGAIEEAGLRHFYIYFDSTTNPGHDTAPPTGIESGAVDSLHWGTAGRMLYGIVPPIRDGAGVSTVTVMGLHQDTTVQLEVEDGGFESSRQPALSLGAFQTKPINGLGREDGFTAFRLNATLPILAFVGPHGFVPSLDGGYAGKDFLFKAGDAAVYFIGAGAGAPTVIDVQPYSASGQAAVGALEFHLNDNMNQLSSTRGTYSGGCSRPPGRASALSPGTVYYAKVREGGDPVLLQQGVVDGLGLVQVPTLAGATAGTRFAAVVSDTPTTGTGPACIANQRQREWVMSGVKPTVGGLAVPGGAQVPLPAAPASTTPSSDDGGMHDRAVGFRSDGPAWLRLGQTSANGPMAGPLGGIGSQEFSGAGEAVAFGLYGEAQVKVTETFQKSGTSTRTASASPEGMLLLQDRPGPDPLLSYRLQADRPLAVYPVAAEPGFLSGRPDSPTDPSLRAEVGTLEYRGFLLGLGAADGSLLTRSTLAGEPVSYSLEVRNLGRTAAGNVPPDAVDLSVTSPGPGWAVSLDRTTISLGGATPQQFTLTVTPPSDAATRAPGMATVTATSRSNPAVVATEVVTTTLRRSFDVGLWFDLVGGPKAKTQSIEAGETGEFTLLVKNQGSVQDRLIFTVPREPGWNVLLLEGGLLVEELVLQAGQTRTLQLRVEPPPQSSDALITPITVASAAQPASFDRATATTKIVAPSVIDATVTPATALGPPGGEALFDVKLTNTGQGAAEVLLGNRSSAPAGWPAPKTFVSQPTDGSRIPVARITVAPGETVHVGFAQPIPADASAGQTIAFRLGGLTAEGIQVFEAFPDAVVGAVHAVALEGPRAFQMRSGGTFEELSLHLVNRGNLNESLRLLPGPMPPGWSLRVPEDLDLARGQHHNLTLPARASLGAPAGSYNLSVLAYSEDGELQRINFTVEVPIGLDPSVGEAPVVDSQPLHVAWLDVPVQNPTNVPVQVRALPAQGEPWELQAGQDLRLGAGQNGTLTLGWKVPGPSPDGATPHAARLLFEPTSDDRVPPVELAVHAQVAVGRPDLRLSGQAATATPGGRLVQFLVSNVGDRPALDLLVELQVGGVARDRVRIGVLAPGEDAQLALLDTAGKGDLEILVDPEGAMASAGDRSVAVPTASHRAPLPSPVAILSLLAAAMAVRRRRSG